MWETLNQTFQCHSVSIIHLADCLSVCLTYSLRLALRGLLFSVIQMYIMLVWMFPLENNHPSVNSVFMQTVKCINTKFVKMYLCPICADPFCCICKLLAFKILISQLCIVVLHSRPVVMRVSVFHLSVVCPPLGKLRPEDFLLFFKKCFEFVMFFFRQHGALYMGEEISNSICSESTHALHPKTLQGIQQSFSKNCREFKFLQLYFLFFPFRQHGSIFGVDVSHISSESTHYVRSHKTIYIYTLQVGSLPKPLKGIAKFDILICFCSILQFNMVIIGELYNVQNILKRVGHMVKQTGIWGSGTPVQQITLSGLPLCLECQLHCTLSSFPV